MRRVTMHRRSTLTQQSALLLCSGNLYEITGSNEDLLQTARLMSAEATDRARRGAVVRKRIVAPYLQRSDPLPPPASSPSPVSGRTGRNPPGPPSCSGGISTGPLPPHN